MNTWIEEAIRILTLVIRKPGSPMETIVTAALIFTVFLTIMWLAGLAFKMPDTNLLQRLISGVLVFITGLAAATAASILAAPRVEKESVQTAIVVGSAVLLTLAAGVPLAMLTMRAKYFQTLFAVVLSIAAAWGVSMLSETVFGAINRGMGQAKKAADRKEATNRVLDEGAKSGKTEDQRDYKIMRSRRAVEKQKRDEARAAEEKAAREQAIRDKYK